MTEKHMTVQEAFHFIKSYKKYLEMKIQIIDYDEDNTELVWEDGMTEWYDDWTAAHVIADSS